MWPSIASTTASSRSTYEGEDPVALPHEVQALPGQQVHAANSEGAGTYYVAVHASHPEYKLRTRVYDPPPYTDPQRGRAHRARLHPCRGRFVARQHAAPRRHSRPRRERPPGNVALRGLPCDAFPAARAAVRRAERLSGGAAAAAAVPDRALLQQPAPVLRIRGAGRGVGARDLGAGERARPHVAPAGIFESRFRASAARASTRAVAEYLKLYYAGRDKLPPDETNGNTPLVSAHEVAWYAWTATKDPRMGDLIAAGEVKNMVDLCYQTLALAEIDRDEISRADPEERRADPLAAAAGRAVVDAVRGEPAGGGVPDRARAVGAAGGGHSGIESAGGEGASTSFSSRQQTFGGWMDPLQSFENFRTPFRETQMAVLALSAYFPSRTREGWNRPGWSELSTDPVECSAQLDDIWDAPSSERSAGRRSTATRSTDALIRQAAAEALGRLGQLPDAKLLGDPSKMVQRTAAWALGSLTAGIRSMPVRTIEPRSNRRTTGRDGARRASFARISPRSRKRAGTGGFVGESSPTLIRVRWCGCRPSRALAVLVLDRRTRRRRARSRTPCSPRSARTQHPLGGRSTCRTAVYNLADENIRYLYNNWVALLPRPEDRDRAIRGRLAVESRLAEKFAAVLESGPASQKKAC